MKAASLVLHFSCPEDFKADAKLLPKSSGGFERVTSSLSSAKPHASDTFSLSVSQGKDTLPMAEDARRGGSHGDGVSLLRSLAGDFDSEQMILPDFQGIALCCFIRM